MDANSEERMPLSEGVRSVPRRLAATTAIYAVLGGAVTLVGWATEVPRLTDWPGTGISMFPNAAVCAMACGFGLLVLLGAGLKRAWARWLIRCAASLATLLGGLTLWEHVSGMNLGIDTLLFEAEWGQRVSVSPMRIGVPASLSFLLLGLALGGTTGSARCRRRAAGMALLPVVIASLSIVGYWFGASQLFGIARYTGIAFQTSTIVAALGLGLVAAVGECGITAFLMKPDAGGVVARRLFLPMVGIPVVLGWSRILGVDAGWYDDAFGTAIRTLLEIAVLLGFLWWAARSISDQAAAARVAAEERGAIEQRFFRFMQSLPGLAWIKDAEGRYVYANDAAMKAFQTKAEELYGFTDTAILPEDTARMFMENDRLAAQQAEGLQFVETLRHGDGELHSSLVTKFPIQGPGATRPLVGGIAIDITDRLRAEEALRDAGRKKDEFLATLAHELRNPLAPIRTGVEVLKQVMDQPDKAAAIIGVIERQTAQMVRLIDDLLDVSRITRGKLELRNSDIDLGEVLTAATETVQPLLTARGHELSMSLPESSVLVHGDAGRLSQVFSNLLSNAARYTPEGGKIRLGVETAADRVTVSIADNGDGIEPDMQHAIFEMFTQVKRAGLCPTDGGLGIGLTLVRLITEMHGGTVDVRSEGRGTGSEFRISLPRIFRQAETVLPSSAAHKNSPPNRGRILVVDDAVSAADILSMFFDLEGFETRTAYNGATGLEVARDHCPHVAFIDIGMPEMDGNETARRLREIPGCESTILIALTGWGQVEDRRKTQEAGFHHHLVKPAAPATLREMLTELDL
ncbi:MAG: ATP-binding protein [Verrucomicrobiota bacterium]